jgi:bifunctional UDP-N-acetylglucosamine pyrophosphorylase/glucosamine-1-phosphate N-acetyltransferase
MAAQPLSIVILAAGEGRRMKSTLPKVLQPLAGRPLLKHVIDTARSLEPAAIHVVYGHGGERVREALAAEGISWVLQAERLGTGHAAMQAIPQVPDEHVVMVLFGDVPLIPDMSLRELALHAGPGQMALLTMILENPSGYGRIVRNARGAVQRIVEDRDADRHEKAIQECNTGVMVMPAGHMKRWLALLSNHNTQGEYYLTDVVALAVKDGVAVNTVAAPDPSDVLGVNDRLQLAEAEAAYRRRVARELMMAGVTVVDPARLDVRGRVIHGMDVTLDVNVVLEGTVKLGNRVRIGPHCVIRDCEIGDDTEIFPCCVLDGAIIGPSCNIGPFARFRPSVRLAAGVHIGNFVEVKNSAVGEGSKANHLTYVGDATVGTHVNLGAGTIVANYDGAAKHRTVIGDDVHTGSNSVLVAPITVGCGATVAAGSTVSGGVPPGGLTIARSRQLTLPGWQRPRKARRDDPGGGSGPSG